MTETKVSIDKATIQQAALELYTPPFRFAYGFIWDAKDNMVADEAAKDAAVRVRGWGRIQYRPDSEKLQDAVGELIAEALTEYWTARVSLPAPPPKTECPDCGCSIERHNAVNDNGGKVTAHCGACGTCWKTAGTDFVEAVRRYLSPAPPDKQDAAHESLPKLMAGHEWRELSAASRFRINEYAASVEKLVEAARLAHNCATCKPDGSCDGCPLGNALKAFDQG